MLLLAADENLNNDILRGLLRYKSDIDIVRVQDAGLSGADDPTVLEWAAQESEFCLPMMHRHSPDLPTIAWHLVNLCPAFLKLINRYPSVW